MIKITVDWLALNKSIQQEIRKMTGFNMPPGCNVSDIPGNSPVDQAAEAQWEHVYNMLNDKLECKISESEIEILTSQVVDLLDKVRSEGYCEGVRDYHRELKL